MQVLVVNDSNLTLAAMTGLLEANGYDVVTATNGREALDVLETTTCQLVLLDWEMPVMDGPECCREIRERYFGRYICVVFLTAHEDTKQKIAAFQAGADDYVVKSGPPDELLARLGAARRMLQESACPLMVRSLSMMIEAHHEGVESHGPRVSKYCQILLQQLRTTERYRDMIDASFSNRFVTVCHLFDIGCVGIPDRYLLKRGRLTDAEFEIYKNHPYMGARIFDRLHREFPNVGCLAMARDMAATHHERFDGSGYPTGLKGENIPLVGRILFLADTYDALTAPGRSVEPFSHDYAKWLISRERSVHFDPDVVLAFLAGEEQFREIGAPKEPELRIDL